MYIRICSFTAVILGLILCIVKIQHKNQCTISHSVKYIITSQVQALQMIWKKDCM